MGKVNSGIITDNYIVNAIIKKGRKKVKLKSGGIMENYGLKNILKKES